MSRGPRRRGDAALVAGAYLLLTPLALFWIAIITRSEAISRLLFGAQHGFVRDVVPVVVLPGLALVLIAWRLRRGAALGRPARAAVRLAALFVLLSFAVIFVYLIGENAAHAGRSAPR